MRLLLLRDIPRLGNLGDVVDVTSGYARNYLLPQRLAAEPTEENLRAIEEERKKAAAERARRLRVFSDLAARLQGVSVTIEAAANPEGTLYGSVGPKEIADALHAQGLAVRPEHIVLAAPLRTLDNRVVALDFGHDIKAEVAVWIVRQGGAGGEHPGRAGDEPRERTETGQPTG
jgi:large subunit ribosomal protein L9